MSPSMASAVSAKPTVASVDAHTMGTSLRRYLEMKVHPDIQNGDFKYIRVVGKHLRETPTRISTLEKTDNTFSWQRPTSLILDDGGIEIMCFPGPAYVKHHATAIATYLSLEHRDESAVMYVQPSQDECMAPLMQSNLRSLGKIDVAVLGCVHALRRFTLRRWEGGDDDLIFAWQKMTAPNGARVAFIGCRVSFWGDIAGNVVRALQQLNSIGTVLYVGKLGTLRPDIPPNCMLATGDTSLVDGQVVKWKNRLEDYVTSTNKVVVGKHYTLPSVLDESKHWLTEHQAVYDFVDPEIGHMAKASIEGGTKFAYLHIVSDNIARKYTYDLSNERMQQVLQDRQSLVDAVQDTLEKYFGDFDNNVHAGSRI